MQRSLNQSLIEWKDNSHRQPLLLRGARQTGKTYLVEDFASTHFSDFLLINLERDREYWQCFETLKPQKIIEQIELISGQEVTPGRTLLFLDEIQERPQAIQALRYFYEEVPELHVIGAGSLLEFSLKSENFSMPVGRVTYLYLYPMTFSEVLLALGEQRLCVYLKNITPQDKIPIAVHERLLELLRLYFVLGGMPQVINSYVEQKKLLTCRQQQAAILNSYRDDFSKYATSVQQKYCERVFTKALSLIAKQVNYKDIDPDLDYRGLKRAIFLLFKACVLTPVFRSSASGVPLSATHVEKNFKLLFLDLGLVQAAGKLEPQQLLKNDIMQINQGALTEQFVGQHLLTLQPNYDHAQLYYWKRDKKNSSAEVDYIMQVAGQIVPVEVKSGASGRLKSLKIYMESKKASIGIKLSTGAFSTETEIWSIPLYLIEQLPRLLSLDS